MHTACRSPASLPLAAQPQRHRHDARLPRVPCFPPVQDLFTPGGHRLAGCEGEVVPGPVFRHVLPQLQPHVEHTMASLDTLVEACTGKLQRAGALPRLGACWRPAAGWLLPQRPGLLLHSPRHGGAWYTV